MTNRDVTNRRWQLVVGAALLSTTLLACKTVLPYYDYASEPDPRKSNTSFVLGPGDVLKITVWKNEDMSGDAVVRPDGTISLPLLGEIPAAGRSPGDLQKEIAQRLTTYVKDESAAVTVAVTAVNSYRFVVLGNVDKGGTFTANHYTTVAEAIALAGGPNKFADPDGIIIIRPVPGGKAPKRIPVSYTQILEGSHPEQDLVLLPGDTVYVP